MMISADKIRFYGTKAGFLCAESLRRARELFQSRVQGMDMQQPGLDDIGSLSRAAAALGVRVEALGEDVFEFSHEGRVRRMTGDLVFDFDNAFTYWACGNKYVTFELLRRNGFVHTPRYRLYDFEHIRDARRDFARANCPVVIKPCAGTSSGHGITVDVRNRRQLNAAIFRALQLDRKFLMEDYVEGWSFRLMYYGDQMLGAVHRIPARVVGDGRLNVGELIAKENQSRLMDKSGQGKMPIHMDGEVRQTLKNQRISLNFIPGIDEVVYVRTISNFTAGGEVEEVSAAVHPDTVKECGRIAAILDNSLLGVDIICKDIGSPLGDGNGCVNEVNTSPGIDGHYRVTNQDQVRDVAREIVSRVFDMQR